MLHTVGAYFRRTTAAEHSDSGGFLMRIRAAGTPFITHQHTTASQCLHASSDLKQKKHMLWRCFLEELLRVAHFLKYIPKYTRPYNI